jgi:hypothetical protein
MNLLGPSSGRWLFGVAMACLGCSTPGAQPPPTPREPAASVAPASASAPLPLLDSASATGSEAANAPSEAESSTDLMAGAIDKKVTTAQCDFARSYRGTVGDSALSVVLAHDGSKVSGALRYDSGSGELELAGTLEAGELIVNELVNGKTVGTLTARCAATTGVLSGTWRKEQIVKPLTLKPLPSGGTPIAQPTKQTGLGEESRCTFNVAWPAVFGLHDAARTSRINAALKLDFNGVDDAKIERDARACPKDAGIKALGFYAIEANDNGVLSVLMDGYLDVAPSVHGDSNAATRSVSIDVPTGKVLALTDIVTSSRALRPVVTSCMELTSNAIGSGDAWWWEREIQGVPSDKNGDEAAEDSRTLDPKSLREPSFIVLPDGLAVLIPQQPTVSSFLTGRGPVLQWGALVRAGILKGSSPVARLWSGAKSLPAEAPACVRFFVPAWAAPRQASK